jgi:secreted Zn-dependent insulinase-like peptidase
LNKNIITKDVFSLHKIKTEYENYIFNSPHTRIDTFFNKKMCKIYYDDYDILSVLNNENICNIDNVKNIGDNIFKNVSLKMITCGNCSDKICFELGNIFEKFIKNNDNFIENIINTDNYILPITNDEIIKNIINTDNYILPITNDEIIKNVENPTEKNSAMSYYVFIDKSQYGITKNWVKNICLINLLDKIISTQYFNILRTKESYGYLTFTKINNYGNKKYISKYYVFTIQSEDKHPKKMISRTEKFLINMTKTLEDFSELEINKIIDSLIKTTQISFNNINEMAHSIFFTEIETEYCIKNGFNLRDILVETYKKLTKNDLLNFYNDKFITNKKSLAIGIIGKK